MRPGNDNEPGIVAVLDTRAECKVVLDAIKHTSLVASAEPRNLEDFNYEEWADSTPANFLRQTREIHYSNRMSEEPPYFSSDETWQFQPEFRIRDKDIVFVKRAAERILNEKRLPDRLYNKLTKRTSAAQTIVNMLTEK